MAAEVAVARARGTRRTRRLRPIVAAGILALLVLLTVSIGMVAWLVYQPTTVDTIIYRFFERARAPSRAALYQHVYRQVAAHTRYNDLHYAVHEIAGQVAWLTGHANAAFVQWHRAGYHRPTSDHSILYRVVRPIDLLRAWIAAALGHR